jgi:hypothetical protein
MKIYFVDDLQENRETWFNSFSNFIKKKHELKTFESEVANEAMLRAGAHLTLKKIKGVPQTESIQTRIQSEEDLIALLKYKDQAQGVE